MGEQDTDKNMSPCLLTFTLSTHMLSIFNTFCFEMMLFSDPGRCASSLNFMTWVKYKYINRWLRTICLECIRQFLKMYLNHTIVFLIAILVFVDIFYLQEKLCQIQRQESSFSDLQRQPSSPQTSGKFFYSVQKRIWNLKSAFRASFPMQTQN